MKKPEIILRLLRIPFDFFAVLGAFVLAYFWRTRPDLIPGVSLASPVLLPFPDYLSFSLQAAVLVVLIFAWERLYSLKKSYRFRKELRRMITLTGAAFTVIILYFFLAGVQFFSRFILGAAFVLALVFMLLHRFLLRRVQFFLWKRGISCRRIVFLGEGKVLEELSAIWKNALGFEIVGKFSRDITLESLESFVKTNEIDEVVQVAEIKDAEHIVEFCQLNGIDYRFVPSLLEVQRTNTEIDFVQEIPIITLRPSRIDWWARVIKRSFDTALAFLALVLLSPVFLVISLLIKLQDRGPVFYKSPRVSRQRNFLMWKFRSMVIAADDMKQELLAQNRRDGPLFKIQDDPRVTRFGKLLRKTSLDELPQLWNVLKGDLSLVGPRAHMPEEIAQYENHHRKVLAVKAGVTGLAQISGRSKLSFEEEVKLDVYYLENWSLWLDIKILIQTFGVLMDGE